MVEDADHGTRSRAPLGDAAATVADGSAMMPERRRGRLEAAQSGPGIGPCMTR